MKNKYFLLGLGFIIIAALARLIKHPANFSPVGSMALFGGAVFVSKYWKYAIPIIALFVSDFILNNTLLRVWYPDHEGLVVFSNYMLWSYASFICAVMIGHFFIKEITVSRVLGGAVAFTAIFFIISNFGVWMSTPIYPKNAAGLMACYGAAIPFVKSSLAGNLFYSILLFGGYSLIAKSWLVEQRA